MSGSLKRKSFIALAWDMVGSLGSHGVSFGISIFLARLLSPEEFGLVGMAMVFIAVIQVLMDFGFSAALIQRKDDPSEAYNSVFWINMGIGLGLTAIGLLVAPYIAVFYGRIEITGIMRWLSLIFTFNAFGLVQTSILKRALNFKALTYRQILAGAMSGLVAVYCAYQGYGVYSLVIQQILFAFVGSLLLWVASPWRPQFSFSFIKVQSLWGYSGYVFIDQAVSSVFQRLDVLLIGKIFSPSTLGYYTRATSLNDLVARYSSSSLLKVFFPVFSSLQDSKEQFQALYLRMLSLVTYISYGLTGLLFILGEEIIIGLFGEKWHPSVLIFQALILGVSNRPMNALMINAMMGLGMAKENFRVGLLRKTIRIFPLYMAFSYGIIPFLISTVIVSYALTVLNVFFLNRYAGFPLIKHFKSSFVGLIPLLLLVFLFLFFPIQGIWFKASIALIFISAYAVYGWLLKIEGVIYIIEIFRSYIIKLIK